MDAELRGVAATPLTPGECRIAFLAPAAVPEQLLDAPAKARIAQLRHACDRARHATASLLARAMLWRDAGPDAELILQAGRAPLVTGEDLRVSVSHSGSWVVVALTRQVGVGVDVERLPTLAASRRLLDTILNVRERRAYDALRPEEAERWLTRAWTCKEAVLKSTGIGLAVDPRTVVVEPDEPRLLEGAAAGCPPALCSLHDVSPDTEHAATLALVGAGARRVAYLDGGELLARFVERQLA